MGVLAGLFFLAKKAPAAGSPKDDAADGGADKEKEETEMEAKQPFVANIPLTNADEQKEVRLLAGCKKFILQMRADPATGLTSACKLYFIKDGAYFTINQFYAQDGVNFDAAVLWWVSCPDSDQVLEVLQWT